MLSLTECTSSRHSPSWRDLFLFKGHFLLWILWFIHGSFPCKFTWAVNSLNDQHPMEKSEWWMWGGTHQGLWRGVQRTEPDLVFLLRVQHLQCGLCQLHGVGHQACHGHLPHKHETWLLMNTKMTRKLSWHLRKYNLETLTHSLSREIYKQSLTHGALT